MSELVMHADRWINGDPHGHLVAEVTDHDQEEPGKLLGQTVVVDDKQWRVAHVLTDGTLRDHRGRSVRLTLEEPSS